MKAWMSVQSVSSLPQQIAVENNRSPAVARATYVRVDWVLLAILLIGLAGRVYLASTTAYIHDEANTSIPLARNISFVPGHWNLPLRAENHAVNLPNLLPNTNVKLRS